MRMRIPFQFLLLLACLCLGRPAWADGPVKEDERPTIGVAEGKISKALLADTDEKKRVAMGKAVLSLDSQLINELTNTNKFTVLGRSDLDQIVSEQALEDGKIVRRDGKLSQAEQLRACHYILIMTVTGFEDIKYQEHVEGQPHRDVRRTIQLQMVAKVYDAGSGAILASHSVEVKQDEDIAQTVGVPKGDPAAFLLNKVARQAAHEISMRVIDVVYPARVEGRDEDTVLIDRGDGTDIRVGQVWEVFEEKQAFDEESGKPMGVIKKKIGTVKVSSISPKNSLADILDEKPGKHIARGNVVQRKADPRGEPSERGGAEYRR
jgi:hypothetical protein